MATKMKAIKPAEKQTKLGDAETLRNKMPNDKKLSRAKAIAVLAALELTRGEFPEATIKRRGLKVG